jgi:hypothetical protein
MTAHDAAEVEALTAQALRLTPVQRIRLVEQVLRTLEQDLSARPARIQARPPLRGVLADLGPAPSAEDIDVARREAWSNFPREDL